MTTEMKPILKALQRDLDNALEEMYAVAADLNETILSAAIAMNDYQMAKSRIDLIESGALLNADVTGAYTNEKQRIAAVKVHLAANVDYLAAMETIYKTYALKASAEGLVEKTRANLSACKRKCEMLVAVARVAGME